VVMVGPDQPAGAHALAAAMNQVLGNANTVVHYIEDPNGARIPGVDSLRALTNALDGGQVEYLVILGGNPGHDAPADLQFADAIGKAKQASIRLGLYEDETSARCSWHVPQAHYLESWSDSYAWDGTHTVGQPLIQPMLDGKSAAELVAMLAGRSDSGHDLTKAALVAKHAPKDPEEFWKRTLHDGLVAQSAFKGERPEVGNGWHDELGRVTGRATAEFEALFIADASVYDGRFSNNGWLQEQPDPMTKIAWDNAALISPHDADALGVSRTNLMGDSQHPMVDVSIGDRTLSMVAFVLPGIAKGTVVLPLGYGRKLGERVAGATSYNAYDLSGGGFDTYPLRTAENLAGRSAAGTVRKGAGS